MGIRKHFEKKGEGDLKLQDLSLEQEESEKLKFDPETEISKTDWQGMKNELGSYHQNKNWLGFAYQAMHLKILFPDKTADLDLDSAWQGMKGILESDRRNNNWWGFTKQAMRLKVLFPERVSELNLDVIAWQKMKDRLEKALNPSYQATYLKILFPNKMSDLNLNPVWQKTETALEECREDNDWSNFANLAMNLKILAADKVETTDQGLEITMLPPESFKSPKKPRPERKNF